MLRLRMLVTALALAALSASSVPTVATANSRAHSKPACKRAHSTTVAGNRFVRVFTRPGTDDQHPEGTDLLGCWKQTGRTRLLASAFDDDYTSSAEFGLVRIRGQFVAYYVKTYDIGCKADCPPGYQAKQSHLHLVDLRFGTGFTRRIADRPAGNRLLLDGHGAISWPQWLPANQVEVRAVDAAGERVLDSGAIRPESLELTPGGRLSWVNDFTVRNTLLEHRAP